MITEEERLKIDKLLKRALDEEDILSEWENSFVSDLIDKLEEYGTDLRISTKQQEILDRIERKLDK